MCGIARRISDVPGTVVTIVCSPVAGVLVSLKVDFYEKPLATLAKRLYEYRYWNDHRLMSDGQ